MADTIGGNAAKLLTDIVVAIERDEAAKADIAEGIKLHYLEAKLAGFDTKALRKVIAYRKMGAADREAHLDAIDVYLAQLGSDLV